MDIQELINRIRQRAGTDDQETQALLARVASNATLLAARAAVGEPVEADLLHLKAQASNLSAEFQSIVSDELLTWLQEKLSLIIAGALVG